MKNGLIYNTFGLKVEASTLFEYSSEEELKSLIAEGRIKVPYLHMGGGSNLLFINERY